MLTISFSISYFLSDGQKRGAKIYAEFLGGSFTCDAYHMTEPHPNGKFPRFCTKDACIPLWFWKACDVAKSTLLYKKSSFLTCPFSILIAALVFKYKLG